MDRKSQAFWMMTTIALFELGALIFILVNGYKP